MRLKLVTVAFDPALGAFPPEPLVGVDGEILSVVEHFFYHAGLAHLLLVVQHRPEPPRRNDPQRARDNGPESELSEPERAIFHKLRAWRTARSKAEAVPPYVILTNRQLADIARAHPLTLAALGQVEGLGEARLERFGTDLLAVVADAP